MSLKQKPNPIKCHCCDDGCYKSFSDIVNDKEIISDKVYIHAIKSHIPNFNEAIEDSYMCLNAACKHIYRNYRDDIISHHVDDYRDHQWSKETKSLDMGSEEKIKLRSARFKNILHMIETHVDKDSDVLEIASGRGYFLLLVKNYFKSITGMDIDPKTKIHNETINPEVPYIVSDFLEMDEDKQYDVIFALDVLEHIENIQDFPKKISKLAKKVVVQVPTDRPIVPPNVHLMHPKPEYKTTDGSLLSVEFDGHLHYFTEFSLNNLFTKDNIFKCSFLYKSKAGELAGGPEILAVYEKIGD